MIRLRRDVTGSDDLSGSADRDGETRASTEIAQICENPVSQQHRVHGTGRPGDTLAVVDAYRGTEITEHIKCCHHAVLPQEGANGSVGGLRRADNGAGRVDAETRRCWRRQASRDRESCSSGRRRPRRRSRAAPEPSRFSRREALFLSSQRSCHIGHLFSDAHPALVDRRPRYPAVRWLCRA